MSKKSNLDGGVKKSDLEKQADMERLAIEADKVLGITTALDWSIMKNQGIDLDDFGGAFLAIEDIAKGLSVDLSKLAEKEQ